MFVYHPLYLNALSRYSILIFVFVFRLCIQKIHLNTIMFVCLFIYFLTCPHGFVSKMTKSVCLQFWRKNAFWKEKKLRFWQKNAFYDFDTKLCFAVMAWECFFSFYIKVCFWRKKCILWFVGKVCFTVLTKNPFLQF